jgi:hypothetical protein
MCNIGFIILLFIGSAWSQQCGGERTNLSDQGIDQGFDQMKRVIPCVPKNQWKSKITYDPRESFITQIQESEDLKGLRFLDQRFTKIQVNNLILSIDCDTEIPGSDSRYILKASIIDSEDKPEVNPGIPWSWYSSFWNIFNILTNTNDPKSGCDQSVSHSEQITFRLLNGNKHYTSDFENVDQVDQFLHHVHGINVLLTEARHYTWIWDNEVRMMSK